MKEIKECFKKENYECNLLITDKSIEIGLIGNDSTDELVLEYFSFDEPSDLLNYLDRIENNSNSNELSIFSYELKEYLNVINCFRKILQFV